MAGVLVMTAQRLGAALRRAYTIATSRRVYAAWRQARRDVYTARMAREMSGCFPSFHENCAAYDKAVAHLASIGTPQT